MSITSSKCIYCTGYLEDIDLDYHNSCYDEMNPESSFNILDIDNNPIFRVQPYGTSPLQTLRDTYEREYINKRNQQASSIATIKTFFRDDLNINILDFLNDIIRYIELNNLQDLVYLKMDKNMHSDLHEAYKNYYTMLNYGDGILIQTSLIQSYRNIIIVTSNDISGRIKVIDSELEQYIRGMIDKKRNENFLGY